MIDAKEKALLMLSKEMEKMTKEKDTELVKLNEEALEL